MTLFFNFNDFLMCLNILFCVLELLKFSSSGSILINLQSSSSESQLKKIQNAGKNENATTIRLSNENFYKNKLINELYLTERQTKKLIKKIENNMSTDIKLSNFLPKLIKPVISIGKNILAPLGLSAAMSATDTAIQKNVWIWG